MTVSEATALPSVAPAGTAARVAMPLATQRSQMNTLPGPATSRATSSRDQLQKEQLTCDGVDMRSND
jgi:hypothetical protein